MKTPLFFLLLCLGLGPQLAGQNLRIEAYEFISRAADTIPAELGKFWVPEDRTGEISDSIELTFVRFKSTNPQPGPPIVYLAGGPGGSGTATAKGWRFPLFMQLRAVADVIAFDQRGTGLSHQLPNCPHRAAFELAVPTDRETYLQISTENIAKCQAFWESEKVNLAAYNTTESARDLEALRRALGVDKMSLWGISYGSHLAFEYIRLFEDRLDKVVLASLEGPYETIKLPQDTEDFVRQLSDLAKDNYGTSKKYPDLWEKINTVHQRLKAQAVVATYKNRRGQIDTVGISNFELQQAVATFYLKNPKDSKKLPQLYEQMYAGDFSEVAPDVMVMKRYILNRVRPMPVAMDLQSGISEERRAQVEQQIDRTILGSGINFLLYEWMTTVDLPPLPEAFRTMSTNQVEALLLSGSLDGRTYLQSGRELAEQFQRGRHVIIENAGHDLYMASPLVGDLVLRFFQGEEVKVKRLVLDPVPFD
ncbi:MAG: alpha/beta hydrolase [Bacteroidota bacterium]